MNINALIGGLSRIWADHGNLVALAAAALLVPLAVVVTIAATRAARPGRRRGRNTKLVVGTAIVQAGVTWVVITGTYAFCTRIFGLPWWEATAFAVFLEASTWVAVGMIYDHARHTDSDGNPLTGFGPAGPFFWLFSALGGLLAVIASDGFGERIGRAVVVVFGACLWYLTLLRVTHRPKTPGRWRWTPRRLLVALGAIEPGEHDVADENREWQVRRLVRAMRWANGRLLVAWWGRRRLTRLAEAAPQDVVSDARRRFAAAYLIVSTARVDSEVMRRVIAEVEREVGASTSEPARDTANQLSSGIVMPPAPRRAREVIRRPVSAPPADSDRETAIATAIDRVLSQKVSVRQAARDAGVPEATLRRRVNDRANDRVNGYAHVR